jgi:hypothetical protein
MIPQFLPLVTVIVWLLSAPGKNLLKGTEHSASAGLAIADAKTIPPINKPRMMPSPGCADETDYFRLAARAREMQVL